jgi:metallo-beta-lactamase family protein
LIPHFHHLNFSLTFLGGAGTVTGSKTLLEFNGSKILIDCGLFQGLKELRLLNRKPFPVNPAEIIAVIVTHAHLDHVGYLPLLVKKGFRGKIYSTPPTRDLAKIILTDSAKLQEEEAELANRGGYSKHRPAEPLYTMKDSAEAMKHFFPVMDEQWIPLNSDVSFRFIRNGHILGSCFVEVLAGKNKIVFSGDIGRLNELLLEPPKKISEADYLILESTYGDRNHPEAPTDAVMAGIVNDALRKQGNLIIPTFAVERAQEVMFVLHELRDKNMIPSSVPVYLDSPMGVDATEVMMQYPGWHKLSRELCKHICDGVVMVKEFSATKRIIKEKHSKIIIAGSGMLSGGRALEYLKAYVNDRRTTVLFVGYQAEGTRGKAMLSGEKTIKIHGENYHVNAEIKEASSFSGHADRSEILQWLKNFSSIPKKIFLNHGDPKCLAAMKKLLEESLNANCVIPKLEENFRL